jgi:hypothetical protein
MRLDCPDCGAKGLCVFHAGVLGKRTIRDKELI